jgi:hypothetical protein
MGRATDLADALTMRPLSVTELDERRSAAKVREKVTTTLGGEIVERETPRAVPAQVQQPQVATWD